MSKYNEKIVAARIRELRVEIHEKSQQEFADDIGVSRGAVAKWERGEVVPYNYNLNKIAKIYGCSFAWLIGEGPFDPEKKGEKDLFDPVILYKELKRISAEKKKQALANMSDDERQSREEIMEFLNKVYSQTPSGQVHILLDGLGKTLEQLAAFLEENGISDLIARELYYQLEQNVIAYAAKEYDRLIKRGSSAAFRRKYLSQPKEEAFTWSADEVIILDDDILDEGTGTTSSAPSSDS